jgi:hypothetical protein
MNCYFLPQRTAAQDGRRQVAGPAAGGQVGGTGRL